MEYRHGVQVLLQKGSYIQLGAKDDEQGEQKIVYAAGKY
jgi:hypothetical protein